MISYTTILQVAGEILENENIDKKNLIILYRLPAKELVKLNEDLYYRTPHPSDEKFEASDVIEVEIGGINFRFEEEKIEENLEN